MKKISIEVVPGCDQQLAGAIGAFSQRWGPYSAESRRHSIFSLLNELIDPAWTDLCTRFSALSDTQLDHVWRRYQWERFQNLCPPDDEEENFQQKKARIEQSFIPCRGKIGSDYLLSALARHHGFKALNRFLQLISVGEDIKLIKSLDSLYELIWACRVKKTKKLNGEGINALRSRSTCRLCGKKTEVTVYLSQTEPQLKGNRCRVSTLYCSDHKPKEEDSSKVRKEYRNPKRNQEKFDSEFDRLDRQSWGIFSSVLQANSGNRLVDEFIARLVQHRNLGIDKEPKELGNFEMKIREAARELVDKKITDRKKEIVALLAKGMNQSQAALQLGIKQQAVSKALQFQSIPVEYRLDLLTTNIIQP